MGEENNEHNEIFGEHYTGEEKIIFGINEHFLNQQGGEEEKRITDTAFDVVGKQRKKYHLECQSTEDNTMLIRMFEYDSQIALDEGEIKGSTLTVTFPHSGVLYLRHSEDTPDEMTIRIVTSGGEISYKIRVFKTQTYSIEEIFEKKLLFLIPFYIFTHESRFGVYNENEHGEAFSEELLAFVENTSLLLYDGQYTKEEYETKKGFGHSTPEKGLELMEKANIRRLLIVHHDPRSTDPVLLEREKAMGRREVRYARQGESLIF